MSYVELHARSAFSFLEGASLPETLVAVASAANVSGMALLDRDGFYGTPRFHMAAQKAGIRAHVGVELTVVDGPPPGEDDSLPPDHFDLLLRKLGPGKLSPEEIIERILLGLAEDDQAGDGGIDLAAKEKATTTASRIPMANYPLLCESRAGYQNLCRLLSKTKLRVPKHTQSAATLEELQEHAEGLVCLTGDEEGPLAKALERGGLDAARKLLQRLVGIFGARNVYVELQRHLVREQEARNHACVRLARELKLPLLATQGVHYATAAEREILDVFTCIKHKRELETAGRLLCRNAERRIRTPRQMDVLFCDLPDALDNTCELSDRLDFTLKKLGYQFPRYPVPDGGTQNEFLRAQTMKGALDRYRSLDDRTQRQLEKELRLIEKLDLAGYFLIVWDIVRFCREHGILVQGRGSAANSAVCYSLGITAIDPVGMDLLFERFLSEERGEWPDIDLDLPSGDEREKAIQYVYQRYGQLGAAMTANVCTYRGRLAAREVGKAFGFDTDTLSRLSTFVGGWEWRGPEDTFDRHFSKAGLDLTQSRIAKYLDLCVRVQDLPRHLSQHSGGMVICQGQLDSVVPLEPATMPGRVVVQWDKDDCADMGIIKVDLLGLGMMAVLKDSLSLIREHYHEEVDLAHLPQDCPDVYGAISRADTIGMFQIESRAQMSSLPRNNPRKFYDLVTQVALIRPGPITGQMTSPYLRRRQGKEPVMYPHPSLEPVLKRTLGVPLFQEQLLRMAMICANFTGGEAEELRRALGHKRSERRMREIENKLRAGMTANGIEPKAQDEIVQFITSFALYGFPESHSASFALIAYASAFLKVRYLAAFTAALLNNQPMGFYSPDTIVKDAQRHGLKVKPVDVTRSDWNCSIEHEDFPPEETHFSQAHVSGAARPCKRFPDSALGNTPRLVLRMGLRFVRGLQQAAGEALARARERGPFISTEDLARRVPELSRANLAMLAKIGALNKISAETQLHRRDALWQIEKAARPVGPLLRDIVEPDEPSPLSRMDLEERLIADYHGTGMTVGPHPMAYRRSVLQTMGICSAAQLRGLKHGKAAMVAGCVITRQRPGTAKGLIFLTLEDETGNSNIIVSPDVYSSDPGVVLHERFIKVRGTVQNQDGIVHLKAEQILPLQVTAAETCSHDFH
ncbi:MAG TPA: error-prone DNA polymerase [Candidatus Angelobacter sp.]|nr:error-prone DNA polymerase [Candidatus Angelobacter sp.]